ncbi:hypothetical protein ASPZODRAFT_98811 [Penicilliopsis zonata CBS 506.65]|uniref:ABC transporter n=1 Tax=Penicilliopsis zonata CBS 506.65 TaxID=1073090 RepID=A0A1L9SFQ4_9EURO|nr:hypothetical protein ASPZODRAFT_98811 [Penicilliopsis zonata CBS 506.65]OJJ45854.1 hypothetical protein ASPZODRAFT_98811 [Penicilliopsis zonata CBS 506.65]
MSCPSDNSFGPRVDPDCRSFDFTLLFEDAFFALAPAALFLLLVPSRLQRLWRAPVKSSSYRLAVIKLSILSVLFLLHLLYTVLRVKTSVLHTRLGLASGIINTIATITAAILSFLEDQRSVKPSDLLVVYYSFATILTLPQLRSLWEIPAQTCRAWWTAILVFNLAVLIVESFHKRRFLQPQYQKTATRESLCGFWGQSFFLWTLPFFQVGYSRVLGIGDLPEIDADLQARQAGEELTNAFKTNSGLMRATLCAYRWTFLSAIIPRICLAAFTFCQPFLITVMVDYMEDTAIDTQQYGQAIIGAYVLVYIGLAVSTSVYSRQVNRFITMTRSGLISIIYTHTTKLKGSDLADTAAVTLMGTDTERIVANMKLIHETWASILEVAIAVWLLERQLHVACLVPAVVAIGSVMAIHPLSSRMGQAQRAWIERVQTRVSSTTEMLRDIKSIKMLGLSGYMFKTLTALRKIELKTSQRFRKLMIGEIVLSNVPATFAPFATFTIYAIIAAVKHDATLLSSQAFTSLSLVTLVTNPLLTFIQSVPSLREAMACFDRIEEYCKKQPVQATQQSLSKEELVEHRSPGEHSYRGPQPAIEMTGSSPDAQSIVSFRDADIAWSRATILHSINLTIKVGRISIFVGPVGAGKLTLLQSILQETTVTSGSIHVPCHSSLAYCAQTPWIINDTIRENILMGAETDPKWYEFALSACGLQQDLQKIPAGDNCMAGSNGVSLSGGQKQRIALCRAIYSRAKLVLLDDVFSGLDAQNISLISDRLFGEGGYFRSAGVTVLLATHTESILEYADNIIVLKEGRIVDILSSSSTLKPEIVKSALNTNVTVEEEEQPTATHDNDTAITSQSSPRQNGTWEVYKYYYHSAGFIPFAAFIFFNLSEAVCSNFTTLWLEWWVETNEEQPNKDLGMYLGVYALLWALAFLILLVSLWTLIILIINSTALNLHTYLLRATLRAPFSFFQTDHGSLTNRFSQDMDLVDMALPLYASMYSAGTANCLVQLVILCVLGKYVAVSVPGLLISLVILQRYYLRTSRQIRLLDLENKAPLYSHFSESVHGMSTIRAFNLQSHFHEKMYRLLNRSQRPFYMLLCIQQWLTLVMGLMVSAIALIIVIIATSLKGQYTGATMGVALNIVLSFNDSLTSTLKNWTNLETSIGAVSRVRQFVQETPKDQRSDLHIGSSSLENTDKVIISFDSVSAGYSSTSVLKNLSFRISPGEKIAICGASGSGKTSLIMALLGMNTIHSGRVSLNDHDLSTLSESEIHALINVVPQDPFLLPGTTTIRENVDPFARASDEEIEHALRKVGMWEKLNPDSGGNHSQRSRLDSSIGRSWSIGEKQLLALARPLAVPKPILILDEASSSVDAETEETMQRIIDTELAGRTVLSVMHRVRFLDRYDRVFVLNGGELSKRRE